MEEVIKEGLEISNKVKGTDKKAREGFYKEENMKESEKNYERKR